MDWTSVYAETGEEEIVPLPPVVAPRLSRLVSVVYLRHHHHEQASNGDFYNFVGGRLTTMIRGNDKGRLSLMSCTDTEEEEKEEGIAEVAQSDSDSNYTLGALYCLSINYILGVGCLAVPYAFARVGMVLGSFIVILVSLLSYMTVMWVAESLVRADLILNNTPTAITNGTSAEGTHLIEKSNSEDMDMDAQGECCNYEVIDLVEHFLGHTHRHIYQASLLGLMFVGLLAYTQVFCGSLSAVLFSDDDHPILSLLFFSAIVIPLSCAELEEQIHIQAIMAAIRFLAIFIMAVGSLVALFYDDVDNNGTRDHAPYFASPVPIDCSMSYTYCFSGFGVAFSTALFSQLFQHSVPGLLRPLMADDQQRCQQKQQKHDQQNKKKETSDIPLVFAACLFTTCMLYLILGSTAASYFGANTNPSVNLNFANFLYGLHNADDDANSPSSPLLLIIANISSAIVVLFPVLDTLSVFPLIANTLGNNLLATASPWIVTIFAKHLPPYNKTNTRTAKKLALKRATRIATICFRLIAAVPPLVGSLWANDLSFSLQLAGVAGLYVAFIAPALLQRQSIKAAVECRKIGTATKGDVDAELTIYSGWYSHVEWTVPVLGFAGFALVVVLIQIRDAWNLMHGV